MRDIFIDFPGFVGIRKSDEKALLQHQGRPCIVEIPPRQLLLDGQRHLEFLQAVERGLPESEYSQTLYGKFLSFAGVSDTASHERMVRFAGLFYSIKQSGFSDHQGYGAVADNGARLDGSHRAAIACMLGVNVLPVYLFKWFSVFPTYAIAHILDETRVKIEGYRRFHGKIVREIGSNHMLGQVSIIDAHPEPSRGWRFWKAPAMEPFVIVDQGNAGLIKRRAAELTFSE